MCDHYSEFDNKDYKSREKPFEKKSLIDVEQNYRESMKQFEQSLDGYLPKVSIIDSMNISPIVEKKKDQIFDTGSRRDSDEHKPRVSDMKAYTRERFGYHLLKGSINYGTGNFEKGQPTQRALESLNRHLAKFELFDQSEDHLSGILFNVQLIMLNQQRENMGTDYFYKQYVASGQYEKDVQRRKQREESEQNIMDKIIGDNL